MKESTSRIVGIRPVIEAIKANRSISKIFIQKGLHNENYHHLMQLIRSQSINYTIVPVQKITQLSKHHNHQGVVATMSPIAYTLLEDLVSGETISQSALFLLLDQITDTRNFGAIIRTAACTGVTGICIPEKGSVTVQAETIKTSAGAVFNVPICKVNHIKDAIYHLQSYGVQVVAASEKSSKLIYDIDMKKPTAIVMGSEAKGVSGSVLRLADQVAKLPLTGTIASLNVSVACGAFLYETVRQRLSGI